MEIKLQSTITCPNCGHKKEETMPTDACQYFYECEKCKQVLKPKQGDCCVYCSYGSVACPPIQQDKKCCCNQESEVQHFWQFGMQQFWEQSIHHFWEQECSNCPANLG